MKEFQDIKAEAEELAILKKEQFYRETLSVKLTEIVRDHLESKKPLQEIISKFEDDLTGLTSLACYMVEDILKDKSNKLPSPKKKKTVAAGELHLPPSDSISPDQAVAEEYAKKYVDASQFITDELNKHNTKTLQEMVDQQAEEDANTAAENKVTKIPERAEKISTLDKISDDELAKKYFKFGMSIPVIASQIGVNPSALYKRIDKLRKEREDNAKECVRQ